jgi:hypothetical protein
MRLRSRHALALLMAVLASAAVAHGDWRPKHGGLMNDGETSFELVVRQREVVLYLEDHGTPIATAGAKGLLTITRGTNQHTTERTAELRARAPNRMAATAPGPLARGDKIVARVTLGNGSIVVGRFVWP